MGAKVTTQAPRFPQLPQLPEMPQLPQLLGFPRIEQMTLGDDESEHLDPLLKTAIELGGDYEFASNLETALPISPPKDEPPGPPKEQDTPQKAQAPQPQDSTEQKAPQKGKGKLPQVSEPQKPKPLRESPAAKADEPKVSEPQKLRQVQEKAAEKAIEPKASTPQKSNVPQSKAPQRAPEKADAPRPRTPQKKTPAPPLLRKTQNKNAPKKRVQPPPKEATPPAAKSPNVTAASKNQTSDHEKSMVKTALLVRPPKDQEAVAAPWARNYDTLKPLPPSSEVFTKIVPVVNKTK